MIQFVSGQTNPQWEPNPTQMTRPTNPNLSKRLSLAGQPINLVHFVLGKTDPLNGPWVLGHNGPNLSTNPVQYHINSFSS
jgi:hypothetical protein